MKSVLDQIKPLAYIKSALGKQPWYLILYITSHCNQRCNMCFAWEMLNSLKKSEEWSLEEFEKIASQFPNLYQLSLTGGEPTLRRDLPEIVNIFHKKCNVKRITIPTNGFYPDRIATTVKKVMKTCPDLILSINMSIDGIGAVHDEIRGLKNSFVNLVESYKVVKTLQKQFANLHLATASVVTLSNKETIKDLLYWVRDNMDISNHGLMLARGDIKTDAGAGTSDDFFVEMLAFHRDLAASGSRIRDAVANEYTQARIDTVRNKKMRDPCLAGRKLMIIDEVGNVLPCEILKVLSAQGVTDAPELGNFSYGNLRAADFDLDSLLYSPRGKAITKFIADERCWCTFECAQINNFALNPGAYLRTLGRVISGRQVDVT